jgi:PTH1 family peptidyl-tRNA hydrolase
VKLIVGLGNPGRKYEHTRHNAGCWWIERLAQQLKVELQPSGRYHGRVAKVTTPHDIWLLLPDTFMNHSGRAVAALAGFHKIPVEDILVVHDELDLQPGAAKLKKGGGSGGHNGVGDIAEQLGNKDFWRLRIGIGHPRDSLRPDQDPADYVLHRPDSEDEQAIYEAIDRSIEIWSLLAAGDHETAMLRLHTRKTPDQPKPQA